MTDNSLISPINYIRPLGRPEPNTPSLRLGVSYPTLHEPVFWEESPQFKKQTLAANAVLARDHHSCRFCGFLSRKYQVVVTRNGMTWDTSQMFTACIFCAQCLTINKCTNYRSGVLLYLPEFSQEHLNLVAKVIYVCRISQGQNADKARKLLDKLMARRKSARETIKTDDPALLTQMISGTHEPRAYADLRLRIKDLRLFPLDRRIIKEADLEYNQFPQVFAYWRSKDGPFRGCTPQKMDTRFMDEMISVMERSSSKKIKKLNSDPLMGTK